jgi:hypothetical protein
MVEVADVLGESETWWADIQRAPDKPPTLADWRTGGEAQSGRLANVLKRAFAVMRTHKET